jgi:hypothetical protein
VLGRIQALVISKGKVMNNAVKSELRYMFRKLRQNPDLYYQLILKGYIHALGDTGVIPHKMTCRLLKVI